jgi:YHS domain-containing protein
MKNIFLFVFAGFLVTGAQAQASAAFRAKQFNLDNAGIGISGYDPVAYFTAHKAVKGSKENAVSYEGVTYYFSSVINKEEFKRNPAGYEPAYGGWCAYAMGTKGEKAEVDPKTFKIVDGKLNLFYNKFFNNTLTGWDKDEINLKQKAATNWSKMFH